MTEYRFYKSRFHLPTMGSDVLDEAVWRYSSSGLPAVRRSEGGPWLESMMPETLWADEERVANPPEEWSQ